MLAESFPFQAPHGRDINWAASPTVQRSIRRRAGNRIPGRRLSSFRSGRPRRRAWANSTMKQLASMPRGLSSDSDLIVLPYLGEIVEFADRLSANPGDKRTEALLRDRVSTLRDCFEGYRAQASAMVGSLQGQAGIFAADAGTLTGIADKAVRTQGADRAKVTSLNSNITALEGEISGQVAPIVGGSLGTLGGILMGVLAIALAPATGGMSLFLLIPAVAAVGGSVTIVTLASIKITELKGQIEALRGQINEFNDDIVTLQKAAQNANQFVAELGSLTSQLDVVTKPWLSAREYFTHVEKDLDAARTSQDWAQLHREFTQTRQEWQTWVQTFRSMEFDVKVAPDAHLTLGMSEAQIGSAVSASRQISSIEYLERMGSF
ncbi:hypothetical protein [Kitasatospora sp. NPDC087315]|uniref:hypothetical protein n=1 Tax=Kitasatospora sp. NPDC087315 TaxID=3364069 RepID=UPI0038280A43